MGPSIRLNYLIAAIVIVAAALVGFAIPLSSGGQLSWQTRATSVVLLSTATPTTLPMKTPVLALPLRPPTDTPTITPTTAVTPELSFTNTLTVTSDAAATAPVTPTATITTTVAVTPVVTVTATPVASIAVTLTIQAEKVRIREGPDTAYPILGTARAGDTFDVIGHNAEGTWWQVCCLEEERHGWIFGELVSLSGDAGAIPVVEVPPPPTPTEQLATP